MQYIACVNLVRVHNIVVATIFDFTTVEDWGE